MKDVLDLTPNQDAIVTHQEYDIYDIFSSGSRIKPTHLPRASILGGGR